jgi:hypothetical protein
MELHKITMNFSENGKGAHIRVEIDLLKHNVAITDMSEPFITTILSVLQIHDISKKLATAGL